MEYSSTRSANVKTNSREAIARGVAEDGGKFVPLSLPKLSTEFWDKLCAQNFCERTQSLLSLFVLGIDVKGICEDALATAGDSPVLLQTKESRYVLDLASGATGMADDIAYAVSARLLSACRKKEGAERPALVPFVGTATECGAFLHAFRGVDGLKAVALCSDDCDELHLRGAAYERGLGAEAFAIPSEEIEDAKKLLRNMSKDVAAEGADLILDIEHSLGRILPYIAIFFSAYCDLFGGDVSKREEIDVALPSRDLTAAVALCWAKRMGLPVANMVLQSADGAIAELVNDRRFGFGGGLFEDEEPKEIIVPVNIERFVFELCGGDAQATRNAVAELEKDGKFEITPDKSCEAYQMTEAGHENASYVVSARELFEEDGVAFDPVTADVATLYELFDAVMDSCKDAVIVQTENPFLHAEETLGLIREGDVKGDALRDLEEFTALEIPDRIAEIRKADGLSVKRVCACDIKDEIVAFLLESA